MCKTYSITKSGRHALLQKLTLINSRIDDIQHKMTELRSSKQSDEDVTFTALIHEKSAFAKEKERIEEILQNCRILNSTKAGKIGPGCNVKLQNHKICYQFTLVEPFEADPRMGKVSHSSPLGKSVSGRKIGEKIEFETPTGKTELQVLEIN